MQFNKTIIKNIVWWLLMVAFLTVLVFRVWQICEYPRADWDTSRILQSLGDFYNVPQDFFSTAHPGLLSFWVFIGNQVVENFGIAPIYYWSDLISLMLVISCGLLFSLLKKIGASSLFSLTGCFLYIASPVISDIAKRSEENIIYHPFFLLALLVISDYVASKNKKRLFLISVISIILVAQHIQPFLIISGGLFLYVIFKSFLFKNDILDKNLNASNATYLFLIFFVSGFTYYTAWYLLFKPNFENYAMTYISIFDSASIFSYGYMFLGLIQGYLLTDYLNFPYIPPFTIVVDIVSCSIGLAVLIVCIWLMRGKKLIDCIALAALAFVFLYEPVSSERWDTFLIAIILVIIPRAHHFFKLISNERILCSIYLAIICIVGFFNMSALKNQSTELFLLKLDRNNKFSTLGQDHIYTDLYGGMGLLSQLPAANLKIINIDRAMPTDGELIFSKDNSFLLAQKKNLNCALVNNNAKITGSICIVSSTVKR